jgi:uncharacterized membrane protein
MAMEAEHTRKFSLERLILFSDAVFAIAITLLVIELRLPELEEISNAALGRALVHTLPHIMSFFLSFFIIGIYWVAHHRMFGYVVNYDITLLWLNLFLLCFIVLMPFSSNILGVYGGLNIGYYLYVFNITMVAMCNFLLYRHISKSGKNLSLGLENVRLVNYYKWRACSVPICFFVGVLITIFAESRLTNSLSKMSPVLIWPMLAILKRRYADVASKESN